MTFNEVQWPSRRSKRLKGFKGFKEVQRTPRRPERSGVRRVGYEAWRSSESSMVLLKCHTGSKITQQMEKIEFGVLQRCNTLFLWHNSVCHCGTARHNI